MNRSEQTPNLLAAVRPYRIVRDCFRVLALSNLLLFPVAIALFGEPFLFWSNPLSDLGVPHTPGGAPNIASFLVFSLNMVIGSAAMAVVARTCRDEVSVEQARIKRWLALIAATGYLIGIFPHDRFSALHTAGCSITIGALWLIGILFSRELGMLGRRRDALLVQAILQLTLLPYAAAYMVGSDAKQALQKLAIAGLVISLSLAASRLRAAMLTTALSSCSRTARVRRTPAMARQSLQAG